MRRFLSARMLGIHSFAIIGVVACLALSNWQWERAHVWSDKSQDSLKVVQPFDELSPLRNYLPATSIGALTEVTGEWIAKSARVYCDRPTDGSIIRTGIEIGFAPGCWVTGVLSLSDDSVITVVLGWSSDNSGTEGLSQELVQGSVTLQGILQPSEDSFSLFLPSESDQITTARTLEQVSQTTHDGYLVLSSAADGLQRINPIFEVTPSQTVHWRNVLYTFNWAFFGLFVIFMWFRAVRDELNDSQVSKLRPSEPVQENDGQ